MILARFHRGKAMLGALLLVAFAAFVVWAWITPQVPPISPRERVAHQYMPFVTFAVLAFVGWCVFMTAPAFGRRRARVWLEGEHLFGHEGNRLSARLRDLENVEAWRAWWFGVIPYLSLRFAGPVYWHIPTLLLDEPNEVLLARFQMLVEQARTLRGEAAAEVVAPANGGSG